MPAHFALAHKGRLEDSEFRGRYPVAGHGKRKADFSQLSERDIRLGRAYYYTMVKLIDREMGRILDALDEHGLADNTIVVFTSDHGELLGDHGLWLKGPFHYEPLIRIPMIIRWPRGFASGLCTSALFSHVDIVPTLMPIFYSLVFDLLVFQRLMRIDIS